MIIMPNHNKKVTQLFPDDYYPDIKLYKRYTKAAIGDIALGIGLSLFIFFLKSITQ